MTSRTAPLFWFAILLLSGLAPGSKAAESKSDLDTLLGLISHPVVVENQRAVSEPFDVAAKAHTRWLAAVGKLKASEVPEVRRAAEQALKAEDMLQQVEKTNKAKAELIAAAARKNRVWEGSFDALNDLLYGLNEVELERLKDAGQISRDDVNAFLRQRGERNAAFVKKLTNYFAEAMPVSQFARQKAYRLQNEAAVVAAAAFAPLAGKVRERAKAGGPTVAVRAALEPGFDFAVGLDTTRVLLDVRNTGGSPITRVSIRAELKTTRGTRTVYGYIPSLAPGGAAWFDPVPVARGFLTDSPPAPVRGVTALTEVVYSVWCDQFRVEDRKLPTTTLEEIKVGQMLFALAPNARYASRGGKQPAVSQQQLLEARRKPGFKFSEAFPPEPPGRYALRVVRFNPDRPKDGLTVELTEVVKGAKAPKVTTLKAVVTVPTPKRDAKNRLVEVDPLTFTTRVGQTPLEFTLWKLTDGCWCWDSPLDRFLPKAVTEEGQAREEFHRRVQQAMREGRTADARALAQEAIDKYPDTPLAADAKAVLGRLNR